MFLLNAAVYICRLTTTIISHRCHYKLYKLSVNSGDMSMRHFVEDCSPKCFYTEPYSAG